MPFYPNKMPTVPNRPYSAMNRGRGWGSRAGDGMPPPGWNAETTLSLLKALQGQLGESQGEYRDWMSGMLGNVGASTRSQLAGGIGSQLSRTNVAIPGGANALANRYMGTLDDQFAMLQGLINKPTPYGQNFGQALSLTQGLQGLAPKAGLDQLMKMLGLGKGGGR